MDSESEEQSGELDVQRTVERELTAAKDKLPPRVLAAIAGAARAGSLGRARAALLAFRAERPDEAAAAAAALRTYAPYVSAALADTLEPTARAASPPWRRFWPAAVIAVAFIVGVRLTQLGTPSPPALPKPLVQNPSPAADPTRAFQKFEDALYPDAGAAERALRQRVEATAEAIERRLPGHDEIASAALEAESSARRGDCVNLKPRATVLRERALAATPDAAVIDGGADVRALVASLDLAVASLCANP